MFCVLALVETEAVVLIVFGPDVVPHSKMLRGVVRGFAHACLANTVIRPLPLNHSSCELHCNYHTKSSRPQKSTFIAT
jgi:hypothetical protein